MAMFGYFIKKLSQKSLIEFVIIFIFFFIGAIIVLRELLLEPGTIGHHWDWYIPPTADYLANSAKNSLYTWSPHFFGYSYGYGINVLIFNYIINFAGFFGFSGDFVSKALMILTIILAGCSMYYLVRDILSSEIEFIKIRRSRNGKIIIILSSLIAGYFYAFSPFLFNEFVGGAYTQFFAYSIAPLMFLCYQRTYRPSLKLNYIVLTAIIFSIIAMSFQYIIFLIGIMFLYVLVKGKKILLSLTLILIIWVFINAYWIIPTLFQSKEIVMGVTQTSSLEDLLLNIKIHTPSISKAFTATGYWTPFFSDTILLSLYPFWVFSAFIMVIVIFLTLIESYTFQWQVLQNTKKLNINQ